MPLPDVESYHDWKDFARALVAGLQMQDDALAGNSFGLEGRIKEVIKTTPPTKMPKPPTGYGFLWFSQEEAELFLANPEFDPPKATDIVFIDTAALADAAITLQKIREGAVDTYHVLEQAIVTAKIGDAAILTALIGELQVVTAKMLDLAVNNAKIANLAVTSGKIANLSVGRQMIQVAAIGTALIEDAVVTNAKIAQTIESYNYNGLNGWRIDKNGSITGRGITILNADGSVAFGSGSFVNLASQTTGNLPFERTSGFGSLAAVSLLTSGNIGTYIQGAAIGSALIGNLAVGSAQINDGAITSAKIGDAQITNAKIASVNADKINAASLSAITSEIGLLRTASSGARMELESNQQRFYYSNGQLAMFAGVV